MQAVFQHIKVCKVSFLEQFFAATNEIRSLSGVPRQLAYEYMGFVLDVTGPTGTRSLITGYPAPPAQLDSQPVRACPESGEDDTQVVW